MIREHTINANDCLCREGHAYVNCTVIVVSLCTKREGSTYVVNDDADAKFWTLYGVEAEEDSPPVCYHGWRTTISDYYRQLDAMTAPSADEVLIAGRAGR